MSDIENNFAAKGERHLAAILAADIVGFSRRMEHDEIGTLGHLRDLRHNLVQPKVTEHRGRIFKAMGDGFLAEFLSALDAVHCAVDIQRLMAARNLDLPEDEKLLLRIGVNLGDVFSEGEDVFGDGVNVAVRLESIAPPGGIYVSRAACDPIRERLAFDFEDLGEHRVKNIARPIQVFGVLIEGVDEPSPVLSAKPKRTNRLFGTLAAGAIVAMVALVAWYLIAAPRVGSPVLPNGTVPNVAAATSSVPNATKRDVDPAIVGTFEHTAIIDDYNWRFVNTITADGRYHLSITENETGTFQSESGGFRTVANGTGRVRTGTYRAFGNGAVEVSGAAGSAIFRPIHPDGTVDPANPVMLGTWRATVVRAGLTWTLTLQNNSDRTYSFEAHTTDDGTYSFADRQWRTVSAVTGQSVAGSYRVIDPSTVELTSATGTAVWHRQ
jgi:class 3 adenylate cyclase